MARHGRHPDEMKIMPGLSPIIGRTEEEANEKQKYLDELTHPIVARGVLSMVLGNVDLTGYDMDGPMPQLEPRTTDSQGIFKHVMDIAKSGNLSMRQTAQIVAGARGKFVVKGTPEHIADVMEEWFRSEACDGFNVMPPYLPGALERVRRP